MITFFAEDVAMPKMKRNKLKKWVKLVAQNHGYKLGDINYIFCSDNYILDVNRQYLQHDYFTDIITFDYTENQTVSGDLFISLDTVLTNSQQFASSDYETEFHRVFIHGILHLCGINDKGPGEREIMEAHENEALKLLATMPD